MYTFIEFQQPNYEENKSTGKETYEHNPKIIRNYVHTYV